MMSFSSSGFKEMVIKGDLVLAFLISEAARLARSLNCAASRSLSSNANFSLAISSCRSLTCPASLLTRAAPSSIVATRSANLRVLIVPLKASVSGFTCTNINVFA
uniref:Uncharacterized protein n=1 Tax=Arundo donax TaxID=35708 RepID=A0A0A9DXP0_ARUDO